MTNNDVLRRLRYALNLPDGLGLKILDLAGRPTTNDEWLGWLKPEEDPSRVTCRDEALTAFLDGLILLKRGPRPEGAPTPDVERLTNNLILKKLRVAMTWKEQDVLSILQSGGMVLSTNELSALFRRQGQKNFKPCGDQVLRAVLSGMAEKSDQGGKP